MTHEEQIRSLVALDDLKAPLSSLYQKMEKRHKGLAASLEGPIDAREDFGNANARLVYENNSKARAMKDGVSMFVEKFPSEGRELQKMIQAKRVVRETHLYFGLDDGRRLSKSSYLGAMESCGLSRDQAEEFYPALMDASREIGTAKYGERTRMIGTSNL